MSAIPTPTYTAQEAHAATDWLRDQALTGNRHAVVMLNEIARELAQLQKRSARRLLESFTGNIEAVNKLGLDTLQFQPVLMAVQMGDISTGRARELLRCWVLGTYNHDMLPPAIGDAFGEDEEPREVLARLRTPTFWAITGDEGGAETPQEYVDLDDGACLDLGDEFDMEPWAAVGPVQTFRVELVDGKRTAVSVPRTVATPADSLPLPSDPGPVDSDGGHTD